MAKLQLMDDSGSLMDAVYFGEAEAFMEYAKKQEKISVTYYPEIDTYQGREKLQVIIRNYC